MVGLSGTSGREFSCLAKKDDKNGDDSTKKNGKQKESKEKAVLEDFPAPNWEGIERKVSRPPPFSCFYHIFCPLIVQCI